MCIPMVIRQLMMLPGMTFSKVLNSGVKLPYISTFEPTDKGTGVTLGAPNYWRGNQDAPIMTPVNYAHHKQAVVTLLVSHTSLTYNHLVCKNSLPVCSSC
jgi:hypothetical protein